MKRHTTAQAIAILSKPGREGWIARATDDARFGDESMTKTNGYFVFSHKSSVRGWEHRFCVNDRPDWRIIKPKREKLRRIGTTAAPFDLSKTIHLLESSDHDYEIFARRVGK